MFVSSSIFDDDGNDNYGSQPQGQPPQHGGPDDSDDEFGQIDNVRVLQPSTSTNPTRPARPTSSYGRDNTRNGSQNRDPRFDSSDNRAASGIQVESPSVKKAKLLERKRAMMAMRKSKLGGGGLQRTKQIESTSAIGNNAAFAEPASSSTTQNTSPANAGVSSTQPSSSSNSATVDSGDMKQLSQTERNMIAAGISPVYDPVSKSVPTAKLDTSDMRTFLTAALPPGLTAKCYIQRNKKGLKHKFFPVYDLFLEDNDKFLLTAKKRSKNKTSNYLLSMDKKNVSKDSAGYLGKLRSNFVGTQFTIYDKGINPDEVESGAPSISMISVRQELGSIHYESNFLGARGPRKMSAILPAVGHDGHRSVWKPTRPEETIGAKFKNDELNDLIHLTNRKPVWNEQVGAFVLNFNGRVTMASVKNFQLVDVESPDDVVLQFGRVGKETFTMDFTFPLSPLQAFAICLSSFDYKLVCE